MVKIAAKPYGAICTLLSTTSLKTTINLSEQSLQQITFDAYILIVR